MKIELNLKTILALLIVLPLISACSNDDLEPGCFQEEGRRIVATITNEAGTVHEPGSPFCHNIFTLEPDEKVDSRPLGSYNPCNLPDEFKINGARVMFSGYVYESFETEDICADFFEITDIRFIN